MPNFTGFVSIFHSWDTGIRTPDTSSFIASIFYFGRIFWKFLMIIPNRNIDKTRYASFIDD